MFYKLLLSLLFLFYSVHLVELGKNAMKNAMKSAMMKNDKFLDYVDFVPLNLSTYSMNGQLSPFAYHYSPLIRSKSLNVTDTSNLEKKKQKEIVTRLIDSIVFDSATDHQIGKLTSADQLVQLTYKYGKADLSTFRLEFLGLKLQEKRKFNHYMIIKKQAKRPTNDYLANRNHMDNSLFYTYQNAPLFVGHSLLNRNANSKHHNLFDANQSHLQSKSLNSNDGLNSGQFVFCSVFVQRNVNFGRKAIRIAFYQSFKSNMNDTALFTTNTPQNRVTNIWLTDGQRPFTTLQPVERLHTLSTGMGMLYKTV